MHLKDYTANDPDLGAELQTIAEACLRTINAKYNATNVNIRKDPGLENPVIYRLQKNEGVTILAQDKSEYGDYGIIKEDTYVESEEKKIRIHKGKWLKRKEYNRDKYKAATVIDNREINFNIDKKLVTELGSFLKIKTASGVTGWAVKKYLDPVVFTTRQYREKRTALHPFFFIKNGKPHIAYTEYNKIKVAFKK